MLNGGESKAELDAKGPRSVSFRMAFDNVHETLEVLIEADDFACDRMRIRKLSGREAISRLFRFEVEIVCLDHQGVDTAAMSGARVTLVFVRAGLEVRRVHGMISEVEDLLAGEADFRTYRLVVVPLAHRLTLIETSDIFMQMTVPEILAKKLELVRLSEDMELRLTGAYPKREFVVQYNETDFAFACRLAEHVGISFFFDQSGPKDKIVFTDHASGFRLSEEKETIHFRKRGEKRDVFELGVKTTLVPSYYVVRDHNYRTPQVDLTSEHKLATGFSGGAIEFGGHFKTPDEGGALARVRAEERQVGQVVFTGKSDIQVLSAGGKYQLTRHPDLPDTSLLVIEVEHEGTFVVQGFTAPEQKAAYSNTFRAIPSDRTFRPARVTPKPPISGLVNGIIEAVGSEKFGAIDEQGRYIVRFLFDTTAPNERKASRPVRMLQQHAGENYGTHFPLRAGTEVLIGFVNGDPDRPVIVGAVPNPLKPSPVTNKLVGLHRIQTETGITIDMLEEG